MDANNFSDKKMGIFLESLFLQNMATFDQETITFSNGLNAIIGETGSGKSLILSSLQLILGFRSQKKWIRKGCEFATVEATFYFNNPNILKFFDSQGFPLKENSLIIKRIIYSNGQSKSFINFQRCPLSVLKKFAKNFIDLVGQFENQKLLSEEYQLYLLDSYGGLFTQVSKFHALFKKLNSLQVQVNQLQKRREESAQKRDFLKFQLEELETFAPEDDEEEKLIQKKENLINFEKDKSLFQNVLNEISDNPSYNILSSLKKCMRDLSSKDFPELKEIENAYFQMEEVSYSLTKKLDQFQEDAAELDLNEILERLDGYQKLKSKYGRDGVTLKEKLHQIREEYDTLENINPLIEQKVKERNETLSQCREIAKVLHKDRLKAAKKLSGEVGKIIRKLKMSGSTVDIKMEETELGRNGQSKLSFLIETNPGEGFYPLKKIASGGELSRVLLGLRKILSAKDSVSIFLFDEIDTGVGGETALSIGQILKEVAFSSQVIAITHLPQLAQYADKLVSVSKQAVDRPGEGPRTQSFIEVISKKNRKEHLQKMTPLFQ